MITFDYEYDKTINQWRYLVTNEVNGKRIMYSGCYGDSNILKKVQEALTTVQDVKIHRSKEDLLKDELNAQFGRKDQNLSPMPSRVQN